MSGYIICIKEFQWNGKKLPQQYADLRHDLREQMQTLQLVPATLQPVNACKVINHTDIHKQLLNREKQRGDFKYNP